MTKEILLKGPEWIVSEYSRVTKIAIKLISIVGGNVYNTIEVIYKSKFLSLWGIFNKLIILL